MMDGDIREVRKTRPRFEAREAAESYLSEYELLFLATSCNATKKFSYQISPVYLSSISLYSSSLSQPILLHVNLLSFRGVT